MSGSLLVTCLERIGCGQGVSLGHSHSQLAVPPSLHLSIRHKRPATASLPCLPANTPAMVVTHSGTAGAQIKTCLFYVALVVVFHHSNGTVSKTHSFLVSFYKSAVIFLLVPYSKGVSIFVYENFLAELTPTGRTDVFWKLLKSVLTFRVKQN